MADGSLARRYARALLTLGQEKNLTDRFGTDLSAFSDVLHQDGCRMQLALNNPAFTVPERQKVVGAVLALLDLHPLIQNFINLLVDKSRLVVFDDIHRAYETMSDEMSGRVRAVVTTASALDAASAANVQRVLATSTGKTMLIEYQVDPELIGGIVARVGDTIYDASVRARLQDLKASLSR